MMREEKDYSERDRRRYSLGTLLCACLLCIVLTFVVTFFGYQRAVNLDLAETNAMSRKYRKLFQLDRMVRENFIYEIDEDYLMDYILTGYAYGLDDPHTYYLNPEETDALREEFAGNFTGIGINVLYDKETSLIYISYVMPDSPAFAAGVCCGDLIDMVEGRSVLELGYQQAVDDMLGEEGTAARFRVLRDGEPIEFEVVRSAFKRQLVTAKVLESGFGYLLIEEFELSTAKQFMAGIDALLAQGVSGIVFDVRGNPGGELNTICEVLDRLVPSGVIVEIIDKNNSSEVFRSDARELTLPMAVLVDGGTASAAELFAATLRDYDKAVLVGETTYGKGSVQTMFSLDDGSMLNLTSGLYYPPCGESYDGEGITPDIEIALPDSLQRRIWSLTETEDLQLQAAVQELLSQTVLPAAG